MEEQLATFDAGAIVTVRPAISRLVVVQVDTVFAAGIGAGLVAEVFRQGLAPQEPIG